MTQFSTLNIELSDFQLSEFKSGTKNSTQVIKTFIELGS